MSALPFNFGRRTCEQFVLTYIRQTKIIILNCMKSTCECFCVVRHNHRYTLYTLKMRFNWVWQPPAMTPICHNFCLFICQKITAMLSAWINTVETVLFELFFDKCNLTKDEISKKTANHFAMAKDRAPLLQQ